MAQASTPMLAALAFTLSVGIAACLLAHLLADLLASRRFAMRWAPLAVLPGLALAAAVAEGNPLAWVWVALVFSVAYGVHLARPPPRPGQWLPWLAAVVLLIPPLWGVTPDHLRDARNGLLALPGGTAIVNAYYRHALLAAEPVKRAEQRLYLHYHAPDDVALPAWFRCLDRPWHTLRVARTGSADIRIESVDGYRLRLRGGAPLLEPANAAAQLTLHMERAEPVYFQPLVALALLAIPFALARLLVGALHRGARCLPLPVVLTVAAGACIIGFGVALALAQLDREPREPASEGDALARMTAAAAATTSEAELVRLQIDDTLLPVRARALANLIRRADEPSAHEDRVRTAATWYEQWYGHYALLARGWSPLAVCRSAP